MQARISNKSTKELFPNAQGIINYAFTLEGTDYYEFYDLNSVPCERGFQALSYYNELEMRCTRPFLKAHQQARKNTIEELKKLCVINNGSLNLFAIVEKIKQQEKLDNIIDERLEFLHEPEIAAKLLSVVYFDESENPHRFDYAHAAKKAAMFLKVQTSETEFDFFLSKPIVKYLPYINSLNNDLPGYCQTVIQMTREHLTSISTMLSEENKNQGYFKLLLSQIQEGLHLTKQKT